MLFQSEGRRNGLPSFHSVVSVCAELKVPKVLVLFTLALPAPNRLGFTTDASMNQVLSHQTTFFAASNLHLF
ncbi:uncharacterized protein PHALS_14804 [Plasmopara halstedii]|uniref:Uncharacterized protein n=1 Tax=Plasmopara halstedii TaxID=4781 RepID=A0A0P1AVD9_PLAHL|nr:uncharacterized protein PHALS_14804 [Plasmopara halstedii]CEG45365.1 hypothetical protein PHALS_14804 [Plasmopara halstedii]|eukprot:XP_024581734.1 hypothetical protein PHALS_14804 [Plasmopara halstedii]